MMNIVQHLARNHTKHIQRKFRVYKKDFTHLIE